MAVLALIQHGQSIWTRGNRFSGRAEISINAWDRYDRAIGKPQLARAEMQTPDSNTETSWLLNKRHYRSPHGQSRRDVYFHYGNKQAAAWLHDYRAKPPFQGVDDLNYPSLHPKYQHVDRAKLPSGESLEDATIRTLKQLDDTQTENFCIATCAPVIYGIEQDLSITKKNISGLTADRIGYDD